MQVGVRPVIPRQRRASAAGVVLAALCSFAWSWGARIESAQAREGDAVSAAASAQREQCQALTRAGKRADAVTACTRAVELGARSALDLRMLVGALVAGPKAPSTLELAQAFQYAQLAVRQESAAPWGYLALCDVAKRLDNEILLSTALWQLEGVAPNHAETKALVASLGARRSRWRLVAGWALLAAVGLATLFREVKSETRDSHV